MNTSRPQVPPGRTGTHLVLYDGVCGLCNGLLRFVIARDARRIFRFAPLQSRLGRTLVERFGGSAVDSATFCVIANSNTPGANALRRSRAVLFVLNELGWPWKLAGVVRIVPARVLNRAYDLVARNRYRLFGRFDTCPVPSPDIRGRFIESLEEL